jgi:hypothetical protein
MEVSMAETNNTKKCSSHWKFIYSLADKVKRFPGLVRREIWKVGKDDPRRILHSLKVGLALALVSLLYLMEPLFKGIGSNAMWAVMTVVVVMEFTVGKQAILILSDIIIIIIILLLLCVYITIS